MQHALFPENQGFEGKSFSKGNVGCEANHPIQEHVARKGNVDLQKWGLRS